MAERRLRLFGKRKVATKAAGEVSVTPALQQVLAALDGSFAGYGSVYRKVTPVRTVIDFLADAVASTPLKVYRRQPNGRPEAYDHPLAVLLRNPNPELSAYDLIWRVAADLAIYANAYWLIGARGIGAQITPLPPFRVTPRGGDLLSAGSYDFFSPNGLPPNNYSASEVVHFRLYDPEDPRIGSSKLEALRTTVLEEVEASKFRLGHWKNNAKIAGVLTHPGTLSEVAQERLQTTFDATYAGPDNAGKTAILEEGAHWTPTAATARESEFIEGREFVLEATARAYNIPLALLGLTQTATFASMREAHKQLYMDVLPPWYERIQAAIELKLLPFFADQDVFVEFVADGKLRGDTIDRIDVLNKAIGRPHMTVAEGRNIENLDDRHVPEDKELVVPVGPNFALEGMAVAAPLAPQPVLAPVAQLPSGKSARSVGLKFSEDQPRDDSGRWSDGGGGGAQPSVQAIDEKLATRGLDVTRGGDQIGPEYHGYVAALDQDGNVAGHFDYSIVSSEAARYADDPTADRPTAAILMVEVDPAMRGEGLATDLYLSARGADIAGAIVDPGMLTPDGSAWWQSIVDDGLDQPLDLVRDEAGKAVFDPATGGYRTKSRRGTVLVRFANARMSPLAAFFARQERSVLPRLAAGHEKAFDRERWDRELAALVGKDRAQEINLRTQVLLMTGEDPKWVFAELKQGEVA